VRTFSFSLSPSLSLSLFLCPTLSLYLLLSLSRLLSFSRECVFHACVRKTARERRSCTLCVCVSWCMSITCCSNMSISCCSNTTCCSNTVCVSCCINACVSCCVNLLHHHVMLGGRAGLNERSLISNLAYPRVNKTTLCFVSGTQSQKRCKFESASSLDTCVCVPTCCLQPLSTTLAPQVVMFQIDWAQFKQL